MKKKIAKRRFLIVDDDKDFCEVVADAINCAEAEAVLAMTLAEAKKKLADGHYYAIVWDYTLPDGNTIELLKSACKKHKKTRMIANSGDSKFRQLQMTNGCTENPPTTRFVEYLLK